MVAVAPCLLLGCKMILREKFSLRNFWIDVLANNVRFLTLFLVENSCQEITHFNFLFDLGIVYWYDLHWRSLPVLV